MTNNYKNSHNDQKHKVSIHWFRNALRFHDNPCLKDACEKSETILPLCVIDPDAPFSQTEGLGAGCIRANFLLESIKELDQKLQDMNSQMVIIVGSHKDVLPKVVAATKATALYYERDPAQPIRKSDAAALQAIKERLKKEDFSCDVKGYDTHTLHPPEKELAKTPDGTAPKTYGSFIKLFNKMTVPKEVETVKKVPPLPEGALDTLKTMFKDKFGLPTLEELGYENVEDKLKNRKKGGIDFYGGEDAALALLKKMMSRTKWVATFEKPKTSPNALEVDTTGLSPYVRHGCLSIRTFYHELSKVYAKHNSECSKPPVSLHGQLLWREYNYLMAYSTPNFDKMRGNPVARLIPWEEDPTMLQAWKDSKTGYPFIDAIMTQLRETGWIHHLARHAVACFLTRGDLYQSWEKGALIFEEELIDADWSVNNFNWQWLSCTAHFYQYYRCYSPIAFGKKTDKNGDYIRKWLPQFKDMPAKFIYQPWEAPIEVQKKCGVIVGENYPHPIVEHKSASKENMSKMKLAYDANKSGDVESLMNNQHHDSEDEDGNNDEYNSSDEEDDDVHEDNNDSDDGGHDDANEDENAENEDGDDGEEHRRGSSGKKSKRTKNKSNSDRKRRRKN